MTCMQFQATQLLDRYSLRATRFIWIKLGRLRVTQKEIVVVVFDPFRAMEEMRPQYPMGPGNSGLSVERTGELF